MKEATEAATGKIDVSSFASFGTSALDTTYSEVALGIETLHGQNGTGDGRARILFCALAMFLHERGILEELNKAAAFADESNAPRNADSGSAVR